MNNYFDSAFKKTIGYEGGLSDVKNDAGGLTKYGISSKSYPNLDIRNLTLAQAKEIYQKNYWDRCQCGNIDSKSLAMQVFDIAVNSGVGTAGKLLQIASNQVSVERLVVDGSIGIKTITKVNSLDGKTINNALVTIRIRFYNDIVKRNATQKKFINGWTRRAKGFLI